MLEALWNVLSSSGLTAWLGMETVASKRRAHLAAQRTRVNHFAFSRVACSFMHINTTRSLLMQPASIKLLLQRHYLRDHTLEGLKSLRANATIINLVFYFFFISLSLLSYNIPYFGRSMVYGIAL